MSVLPPNAKMIGALMQLPPPNILLKPLVSKEMLKGKRKHLPSLTAASPLLHQTAFTFILTLLIVQRVW